MNGVAILYLATGIMALPTVDDITSAARVAKRQDNPLGPILEYPIGQTIATSPLGEAVDGTLPNAPDLTGLYCDVTINECSSSPGAQSAARAAKRQDNPLLPILEYPTGQTIATSPLGEAVDDALPSAPDLTGLVQILPFVG